MAMWFRENELNEEAIERIRIGITNEELVSNVRLIKDTAHSLVFEGIRGDVLVGFVYQKGTGHLIEDEAYRDLV